MDDRLAVCWRRRLPGAQRPREARESVAIPRRWTAWLSTCSVCLLRDANLCFLSPFSLGSKRCARKLVTLCGLTERPSHVKELPVNCLQWPFHPKSTRSRSARTRARRGDCVAVASSSPRISSAKRAVTPARQYRPAPGGAGFVGTGASTGGTALQIPMGRTELQGRRGPL